MCLFGEQLKYFEQRKVPRGKRVYLFQPTVSSSVVLVASRTGGEPGCWHVQLCQSSEGLSPAFSLSQCIRLTVAVKQRHHVVISIFRLSYFFPFPEHSFAITYLNLELFSRFRLS